jgi:hypothetical protein
LVFASSHNDTIAHSQTLRLASKKKESERCQKKEEEEKTDHQNKRSKKKKKKKKKSHTLKELKEIMPNGELEEESAHPPLGLVGLPSLISPGEALWTLCFRDFLKMVKAGLAVFMVDQLAIQGAEDLEKLINFFWEEIWRKEEVQKIQ